MEYFIVKKTLFISLKRVMLALNSLSIPPEATAIDIHKSIPLLVIQWGFLGALVYTSISLLTDFWGGICIRVYFNASFKLLLSTVASIIIYFLYMIPPSSDATNIPPHVLLACFVIGVSPIQFLINAADTHLSRMYRWKRRSTAGNRPITSLEGINSIGQ